MKLISVASMNQGNVNCNVMLEKDKEDIVVSVYYHSKFSQHPARCWTI